MVNCWFTLKSQEWNKLGFQAFGFHGEMLQEKISTGNAISLLNDQYRGVSLWNRIVKWLPWSELNFNLKKILIANAIHSEISLFSLISLWNIVSLLTHQHNGIPPCNPIVKRLDTGHSTVKWRFQQKHPWKLYLIAYHRELYFSREILRWNGFQIYIRSALKP